MRENTGRWADLFLMFAVFLGIVVRFAPTLLARATINDGGMFFAMIEDIQDNRFLLPAHTSYNELNIPFAYPPLSLYLGAFLSSLGISTADVIRWLPPIVSSLAILAFYWMCMRMVESKPTASLATVAYALMPRSFSWYVMGGGLSRSLGIFFLMLTCGAAWRLFSKPDRRWLVLTAFSGAGAVLSHPETGLHTLAACVLIWLFRGRNARGLRDALVVALGVLLLTAPWWASVIAQHGLAPFLTVLSAGGQSGLFWTPWLTVDFAEERFATVLTVLGLIGFAVQCLRREWFVPAWLLVPFVVEPRSAPAIAALPLAILAGVGLADFVLPKIASLSSQAIEQAPDWTSHAATSKAVRIALGYVLFSAFLGAFAYDLSLATYVVPAPSREAMQWVRANTLVSSRFLVLTGEPQPFSDPTAEWFPLLAQRTSVNTIQGQEWTLGKGFTPFKDGLGTLQACLNAGPDCLEEWSRAYGTEFSYVFLEKPPEPDSPAPSGLLLYVLKQDPGYSLVFENAGTAIFSRK